MSPVTWLIIYGAIILLASLAGGWIPMLVRLTHRRMETAVSFVAGVMLGVGLLHLLPHAALARMEMLHSRSGLPAGDDHLIAHELLGPIVLWLLAGFLVMFFIERFFCFHHHDVPGADPAGEPHDHNHDAPSPAAHVHVHVHPQRSRHRLTWTGAAIGLTVHSLIEGIALAASVEVAHDHGIQALPAGLATFLVIVLHKPFDSLTLGTLMDLGGRSAAMRHAVNAAFSLVIVVGVGLFYLGLGSGQNGQLIVSSALAFSAGTFLCIAMSDLLPELQFHQHDRIKLSAALLSGLAVAWAIGVLESRMGGHNGNGLGWDQRTVERDHDH